MATFKAEVYKHQKRSDGTWNVKIRVTHNRQKKYLSTPIYVKQDDITRSSFKLTLIPQHFDLTLFISS